MVMPRRRNVTVGFGVLFLLQRLFSIGFDHIPPVTLIFILAQTLLFTGVISPPWGRYDKCLSGEAIWFFHDYKRLFLAAIEHADDLHLYHNMLSLLVKGSSLERRFGAQRFLVTLIVTTLSSSFLYAVLVRMAFEYTDDFSYMRQCAIGFSGVLFALKVLTTYYSQDNYRVVFGIHFPARYAVWIELLIIHILVPRASFIGHLSGIFVGLLYILGPIKMVILAIDEVLNVLTGKSRIYEYGAQRLRTSYMYSHGTASQYGAEFSSQEHDELSADEIRRRRCERFS